MVNLVDEDGGYQFVNDGAMARQDEYQQFYGDWVLEDGYYQQMPDPADFEAAAEENQMDDIQIPVQEEIILEEIPVQDLDNLFSLWIIICVFSAVFEAPLFLSLFFKRPISVESHLASFVSFCKTLILN